MYNNILNLNTATMQVAYVKARSKILLKHLAAGQYRAMAHYGSYYV